MPGSTHHPAWNRLIAFGRSVEAHARGARLRRLLMLLRSALMLGILAFLVVRLHQVGWGELWAALPATPWFYVLLVAAYFVLPLAETTIYRRVWGIPWRTLPVFVRKRVLNEAIIDYLGEAHLIGWARRATGLPGGRIVMAVKDVNILSAAVSNATTLALVSVALFDDRLSVLFDQIQHGPGRAILFSVLLVLGGITLLGLLWRWLLHLPPADLRFVGLVHVGRIMTIMGLQVAQWQVAVPAVGVEGWLLVLAAQMLLTRLPLVPSKEVAMAALGVALAGVLQADTAQVAAMFATAGALSLILNSLMFVLTWRSSRIAAAAPLPAR